jgi:redox-sensitive bicupin YhaK (pirin superfamily)
VHSSEAGGIAFAWNGLLDLDWDIFQIRRVPTRHGQMSMVARPTGQFHLVASQSGKDGSTTIRQDVDLWLAKLEVGQSVWHSLETNRAAWLQVAEGEVVINGKALVLGDADTTRFGPENSPKRGAYQRHKFNGLLWDGDWPSIWKSGLEKARC